MSTDVATDLLLPDLVSSGSLAQAISEKLINVRESDNGLRIYNYSDLAVYTPGAWDNPAVRQCRGLIVDQTDRVVARPWSKFFNYGQSEAGELDLTAAVEVTDKMDGSLGIVYPTTDGVAVATRGSFASDQAGHATARVQGYVADWGHLEWLTVLVEIIYPENRIVCDYGAMDDLVLLGGVEIASGTYRGPQDVRAIIGWSGPIAETFSYSTLADALKASPRVGAEGMCVRYLGKSQIVKIKQDDYVRLHRIVTGLSEKTVWEHMLAGQPVESLLEGIPDELHAWVRETWNETAERAQAVLIEAEAAHRTILHNLGDPMTRKDYAEQASRQPTRPYLFMLLDGRDPTPAILKSLKPAGDTRYRVYTEDVA